MDGSLLRFGPLSLPSGRSRPSSTGFGGDRGLLAPPPMPGQCQARLYSRRFDQLDVAAGVELRSGQFLLDGGERPDVPERIDDGGDAVAPAGVLGGGA